MDPIYLTQSPGNLRTVYCAMAHYYHSLKERQSRQDSVFTRFPRKLDKISYSSVRRSPLSASRHTGYCRQGAYVTRRPSVAAPLDKVDGRRVEVAAPGKVVDHGKEHGGAEHEGVPVHGLGCDLGGEREEDEDPDHEQEENGASVDKQGRRRPATSGVAAADRRPAAQLEVRCRRRAGAGGSDN